MSGPRSNARTAGAKERGRELARPSFSVETAGFLAAILLPMHALAFNADGFWSGMAKAEFVARAAQLGLRAVPGPGGRWAVARPNTPRALATFGFCGNRLVSYSRTISSDPDYASTLMQLFLTYGPPRHMSFTGDVSMDDGGGAFRSFGVTLWYLGNDRVRLTSLFDWRMNRGDFRRRQPARITYEMRNPCRRR
jgi:hypothetical protein